MASAESSGVMLLVVEGAVPESIVDALASVGWKVQSCPPEALLDHLEQKAVEGVVIRVGPKAELFCLQAVQKAQAARPVLLLSETESMRLAVTLAQTGWLSAAASDQIEQVQAWAQQVATGPMTSVAMGRQVRQELSRLNHDLKNPLAIIAGNAQFLHELLRMRGGDPELEGPVTDIAEACRQMHELLQRLVSLKDALPT